MGRAWRSAVAGAAGALAALTVTGCGSAPARTTDGSPHGTITVLAAASLTQAFSTIARAVERAHPGLHVRLSFGPSSGLAQQVLDGAPADVLATADQQTMATVTKAGDAAGSPVVFTTNTLEIAVPPGNPAHVAGLADLSRSGVRVALCAPQVPCGDAARRLLAEQHIRVTPVTYDRDVKAALAKVELGEVDAALVYRSDVVSAGDRVRGVTARGAARVVNRYPITVLAAAPNPAGARAFLDAVLAPAGRKALAAAGFGST